MVMCTYFGKSGLGFGWVVMIQRDGMGWDGMGVLVFGRSW